MGFSWLDGLILLIFTALILWEIRRDLGQSLFDTVALLMGLRIAWWLGPLLAPGLGIANANQARGVALLIVFVLASAVTLLLGWYLHRLTLWTLDQFDRVAGLMLGFTSAVIVCHLVATSVALMGSTKAGPPKYVKQSWLAQEAISFRTCRQVVKFFNGLRV
jgi:uncharacterized membrane protein required for colicin V production